MVRQAHGQETQRVDELASAERRLERDLAAQYQELQALARQPAATQDAGPAVARFVDLQEQVATAERRLTELKDERERLRRDRIEDVDIARALAAFDPVWQSLAPREQGRLLRRLIERIDYDGRDGMMSITFHASGIQALAQGAPPGDAA